MSTPHAIPGAPAQDGPQLEQSRTSAPTSGSADEQAGHGGLDPSDWTPVIERAFFARLPGHLESSDWQGRLGEIKTLIRARLATLDGDLQHLVRTPMDAANVRVTALAAAAFDVLELACGAGEAAVIVEDCLNQPLRAQILAGTAAMLDYAEDPFTALVDASKDREETYFGPSFTFRRPVDDHDTYVLDITRCPFHEALRAAGRTELQPVLCRFDLNWADAIDPARHHLRFVRPVTFATGDICRMCFTRQEHLPGLTTERNAPAADRPSPPPPTF